MHFLIIGGSDAGIAAGLRAHELDPECEITLVLADEYPNYSICGLPFFLSGETPDWRSLAHRTEFPGKGALSVNRKMETNVADIYAAGDCVETWHRLLNRYTYMPLGTTAHKQGRVSAENVLGGHREFAGSLGTQVVKLFDVIAARTGLRDGEASSAGFDPLTTQTAVWDHKAYYPGAHELHMRITGDQGTGRLLGAQLLGHKGSEVSKRADVFAAALFQGMSMEELSDLDLSYTPPLSSPWDPVQMATQFWSSCSRKNCG